MWSNLGLLGIKSHIKLFESRFLFMSGKTKRVGGDVTGRGLVTKRGADAAPDAGLRSWRWGGACTRHSMFVGGVRYKQKKGGGEMGESGDAVGGWLGGGSSV